MLITPSSLGGVGLSDNQISFSTNTVNGWQGLSGGSRAAVAVGENKPLKMESSLGHPLYLHPIEQAGTYIYNAKDELITRSGAPLPNDGNLLANDNDVKTRGSKYDGTDWTASFGVSAIRTDKSNQQSSFFQNLKATPDGGSWITTDPQYWPTDGSLSFYAYAPYCDDSHKMLSENTDKTIANAKTVHYVASATDIINQPDLIIAKHESVTHGSTEAPNSVSLNFSHVLAAITFAVGSDMVPGTVKSIAIKGVKNEGDFDLSANTWKTVSLQGNADFVIPLGNNGQGLVVKGQQDEVLTTGAQTLMMIPQTFDQTSTAKVEIVFTKDGTDHTLSAPLHNTQWEAGSTIIYKVSTSSLLPTLTLNNVTFPTDWSNHAEYGGKLKSAYQDNDQLGLYVVAADGRVKAANVQVTCKGGKWTFPAGQPHIEVGDKVFAYYPYRTNGDKVLVGMPNATTPANVSDLTSAHSFFKTLEAAWEPEANQSTDAGVNASDLQVSTVSLVNNTASGIDLTMGHVMGLADITLAKGHSNFKLSNDDSYTFDGSHLASNTVEGKQLYRLAKNRYVAVVRTNQATVFNSKGTCLPWKSPLSFQPAMAGIQQKTAVPVDNDPTIYPYTLEPGDVYYSDGACSHQDDDLEAGKTPIGIVGYIGKNKWTEYQTGSGHGGHALVVSLHYVNYPNGGGYPPGYKDWGFEKMNSASLITGSYNSDYGSGYICTNKLIAEMPGWTIAALMAKNFDVPYPKTKCTGWFLPTAGQFYAFFSQIGDGINPNDVVINQKIKGTDKIMQKFDEFVHHTGETCTLDWGGGASSSEYSAEFDLGGWFDPQGLSFAGTCPLGFYHAKNITYRTRPFLAF